MALLNRDQILTVDDLPTEDIPVPEWDGEVRMRGLTGTERDTWELKVLDARDGKQRGGLTNIRWMLLAQCIVDEDGQRLFTDAQVKQLGMKSASVLMRLYLKAEKLSGIAKDDTEELAGNSGETDGEHSPSVSPSTSDAPDDNSSTTSTLAS